MRNLSSQHFPSLQDAVERGWFTAECSEVRGGNDYGRALALAAQIASAMAFLHANNIVHGVRGNHSHGTDRMSTLYTLLCWMRRQRPSWDLPRGYHVLR